MSNGNSKDLILFIDDEKICHTLVELIIPNFTPYTLISAFSGNEALKLAKRYGNRIALVLCDIILPDMNGFEIYEEIHSKNNLKKIPFVFQSGYSNIENELLDTTNNKKPVILYKPYKQEMLLEVINNTIRASSI